jgi:hypothetical protein
METSRFLAACPPSRLGRAAPAAHALLTGAVPKQSSPFGETNMTTGLKLKSFTGVAKIAPANIEARSTETALREAQYQLDLERYPSALNRFWILESAEI